jgi:hypothetical protein
VRRAPGLQSKRVMEELPGGIARCWLPMLSALSRASAHPSCVDIRVTWRMIETLLAEHRASASTLLPLDLVRVSALLLLARLVSGVFRWMILKRFV